jgi:hypothetical protein
MVVFRMLYATVNVIRKRRPEKPICGLRDVSIGPVTESSPKGAKKTTRSVVPRTVITGNRATKMSTLLLENQEILEEIERADDKKIERGERRQKRKAWHM